MTAEYHRTEILLDRKLRRRKSRSPWRGAPVDTRIHAARPFRGDLAPGTIARVPTTNKLSTAIRNVRMLLTILAAAVAVKKAVDQFRARRS